MPAQFLDEDLRKMGPDDLLHEDVLTALAKKFQVSSQALTFRLANLGYVQLKVS